MERLSLSLFNPPQKSHHPKTMQINITSLADTDAFQFSASRAEMGQDAGQITWQNNLAENSTLLDSLEKLETFRDFVRASGGWNREETAAFSDAELNALCHQWIMGDIREAPAKLEGITFREESPGVWYHESEDTPDFETGPFPSRSEAYHDACPSPGFPSADSLEEIDWLEYEAMASAGHISSRLWFQDGQYFFDLSE